MTRDKQGVLANFRLDGRIAVVTGASRGLGFAMAEGLAEAGADLAIVSSNPENIEKARVRLEETGRRVYAVPCDMGDTQQVRRMVEQVQGHFGRLDILVNNAGTIRRHKAESYPEEDWRRILDINLDGVWAACQAAGRIMLEQRYGKIINISSVLGFQGGVLVSPYSASKGAINCVTRALANEWARYNINVNAIAPGWFLTDLTQPVYDNPDRLHTILERIPQGRWGDPEELKGMVVFLASDASSYVNGSVLVIDGGWLAL